MPKILLVNPVARRSKTMASRTRRTRRTRSPAQRAAFLRMIAARRASLAKYKSSAKKPRVRRRTTHPITPAHIASRAGRQLRYRRPNPVDFLGNFVQGTLMPAAVGGAGALGLDIL
ncbi:MAG: hypothetical protein NZM12_08610, partial [Steroidobacteraceae bacterium]|nr:hypothetical protein [Steroidobacteraceae bacterium]